MIYYETLPSNSCTVSFITFVINYALNLDFTTHPFLPHAQRAFYPTMKTLLTTLISLSLLMIALQFFQDDLVFKRTEIDHGEWWRIITGNFVHTNYPHLALNLTGLWIMGFLFSDSFNTKKILMSTVFLSIVTGLLLYWFSRELDWYAGFSGVLYGLFLIGAFTAITQKDFLFGIGVALLIIGKVLWGHFMGGSESSAELIGVPVATDAHLFGITGALFVAAFLGVQHYFQERSRSTAR